MKEINLSYGTASCIKFKNKNGKNKNNSQVKPALCRIGDHKKVNKLSYNARSR